MRALLVEDNPVDARLIREMLRDAGTDAAAVELSLADRLASGVELLGDGKGDVVLRDLSLPDSSGLAREMHDSLAQVLGYVNTKALAVQELLKSSQVARASEQVGQLGEAARAAYADVREGILGLRTSLGPQRGLLEALTEYVQRWREQSGVLAELVVDPPDGKVDVLGPGAELQLLRIIQEALTNDRKHANATRARVLLVVDLELEKAPTAVEAAVEDDGRGFDPLRARGGVDGAGPQFGLATMRERAESIGGSLEVTSAPGKGTRVKVRIPTAASTALRQSA